MPRFTSPDGGLTIETDVPTEAAELRRDGFTEQKFDDGGVLPDGPAIVTNETGSAEVVKTSAKPSKPETDK